MSIVYNVQDNSHKKGAIKTAAKTLIGLGYSLCRVSPETKEAFVKAWTTRSATPDEFLPGELVGIVTGPLSHGCREGHALVGVDLDSFEAVERADEYLPDTGMVEGRPGKPRSHRFYLVPCDSIPEAERSHARQAAQAAIEKYDHPGPRTMSFRRPGGGEAFKLSGTGSQIVVPPSTHSDTGELREWTGGPVKGEPGEPEVIPYPDLLVAVHALANAIDCKPKTDRIPDLSSYQPVDLPRDARIDRARKYLAKIDPAISGQGGHDKTFSAACRMTQDFGLDFDEALALMMNEYNPKCKPQWSLYELQHKVQDAIDAPSDRPRGYKLAESHGHADQCGVDLSKVMPSARRETSPPSGTPFYVDDLPAEPEAYAPFPLDQLPRVLRNFVVAVSQSMRCDPAFVVLPAMAALGAAIGNSRRLMIKRRWYEPPILWTCVVGESGSLKSPAYKEVLRRIRKREQEAQQEYQAAAMEYAREHGAWEQAHKAWKKANDGSDPPEEPVKPICLRFTVSDTTMEALAPILLDNPRGVLLARDELAGWIGSFDRYAKSGKVGADCSNWLSMYSVEPVVIDRKTSEPKTIYIPAPAVCVTGGIQPDILRRALTAEYFENGLAARLLMACPPRRKKTWSEDEIDEQTEREFGQLFDQLWELRPGVDAHGDPEPHLVKLLPEAKAAFIAYYGDHADEQVELDGALSAAWSKLEAAAARIALVLHFVRWAGGEHANMSFVDVDTMTAAIAITKWFKAETRRIYGMLAESEGDRDTRRLIDWISRRGGSATVREIQQSCRWLKEPGKAEDALHRLAQAGLGVWEDRPPTPQGGRPTRVFRLSTLSTSAKPPEIREF